MCADWTPAGFAAAVDALRASSGPDLALTPGEWRKMLRDGSDAMAFRHWIGQAADRFGASDLGTTHDQAVLAGALADLGGLVLDQWARTRDRRALRMAVALWRNELCHTWLTDIVSVTSAVGERFLAAYLEEPALPLLDTAVYLGQDAVFDPLAFRATRPARLLALADALCCRYEHTGSRADLVLAEAHYREAFGTGGPRSAADGLATARAHLAALTVRAAEPRPLAEHLAPGSPLGQASALTTVAATRLEHALRSGDSGALDTAVDALRSALDLTPPDHRDRPLRLARLGAALRHTYLRRPRLALLDEALGVCRAALTLPIDRSPVRAEATIALALAVRLRHDAEGGRPEHLAEARLLAGELARAHPRGHPERDFVLAELGELAPEQERQAAWGDGPAHAARLLRLAASAAPTDPARAVAAYAEAARLPGAPLRMRGRASQRWAELAAEGGDFTAAEAAYELTVDLLPELVSELERRDDQEYQLLPFAGLASDAAACVLRGGGDPAKALDLLERGRCVLFSHALGEPPVRVDEVVTSRVAADGPVVVVNVSRFGSDAFALTAAGTRVIPLPGLTPAAVEDRRLALDLAQDLLAAQAAEPGLRWAAGRSVTRLLGWLWDTVAGPVLDALDLGPRSGPLPRLWWLPTGQLSLLPVHAAGHHTADDGRTVFDRVVSSSTPTLHQLLRGRERVARGPQGGSLVVAISGLPGRPEYALPAAGKEAEVVGAHLPDARTLLDGEASPAAVREALASAAWVHIACHATTDVADPSANRLALAGGDLSVAEIGRLRVPDGHLAYLSACGTARGGDVLSDEVVHISSAFQLAGYPHVIGTLWPIADDVAARIAGSVYAGLPGGADPARRLHAAVRGVRDAYGGNSPLLWASHLHIGP